MKLSDNREVNIHPTAMSKTHHILVVVDHGYDVVTRAFLTKDEMRSMAHALLEYADREAT